VLFQECNYIKGPSLNKPLSNILRFSGIQKEHFFFVKKYVGNNTEIEKIVFAISITVMVSYTIFTYCLDNFTTPFFLKERLKLLNMKLNSK